MISFITLTILTFKKKKKKCLPFSGSKPGRWGAFEDWLVMRCVCKKDINVLLSLKHTISAGSCYIKCFFFFFSPCTRRRNSRVPVALCKLDPGITDNNWAVFFWSGHIKGQKYITPACCKNTSTADPDSVSWPCNKACDFNIISGFQDTPVLHKIPADGTGEKTECPRIAVYFAPLRCRCCLLSPQIRTACEKNRKIINKQTLQQWTPPLSLVHCSL